MNKNKRFKRFLSRVNRGIILGLILGVILLIFVTVDTVKFKNDSKKIQDDIISCISDMAELNKNQNSSGIGCTISQSDRELISKGLDEIFEKYYADAELAKKITVYDGFDKNETARELKTWFDRTASFDLISVNVSDEEEKFSIEFERQGYNYALIRMNNLSITQTVNETSTASSDIFLGGGPSYLFDQIYPEESVWVTKRKKTFYLSGSVYITRVDGEWKILMSDFYTKNEPQLD